MIRAIRPKLFPAYTLLVLLAAFFAPFSLQPTDARKSSVGVAASNALFGKDAARPARDEDDIESHLLAAAYYSLRENLTATLMLNNKGAEPLEVPLTLFSLSGERMDVAPIVVEATSFRVVDLREYVAARADFQEGSLQVTYRGHDKMLGAQVEMVDAVRSLMFDERLVELAGMFASSRLEGVWWKPSREGEIRLVLSNTTDSPLSVTVSVHGVAPKQKEPVTLSLSPHETRVLDVRRDVIGKSNGRLPQAGGISLEHTGLPGALMARGLVQEPSIGFSSSVWFADPLKAKSSKLHGAGLRLSKAANEELTPVVVARNTGESTAVLKGRLPYTSSDGGVAVVSLPDIKLAAGEVRSVDLRKAIKSHGVPPEVAAAGVEFEHTGEPGSIVMSVHSVSESGNQVFRVPLSDPAALPSSTGGYPWRVEDGSSTVVYIKNTSESAQRFYLQASYEGGAYFTGLKTIEGGQTQTFDLRVLRDNGVPDARGQVIPLDATRGQIHWSKYGPREGMLMGRAEQADIASGVSSSYACLNCCDDLYQGSSTTPSSAEDFVDDFHIFTAMERRESCYGVPIGPMEVYNARWSSSDEGVATVDVTGFATAVGAGMATITARWEATTYTYNPVLESCREHTINISESAEYAARPRISSLTPARALIGNAVEVVIGGSGFRSNATVNAGTGISVTINSVAGEEIRATFNIAGDAPPGNHGVTVTSRGRVSNSVNFFVQIPSRLVRAAVPGAPGGIGPLVTPVDDVVRDLSGNVLFNGTRVCGVYRNFAFHLVDPQGQRIVQPFIIDEDFANYVGPFGPPTANPVSVPANKEVTDTQFLGFPNPRCLAFGEKETFLIGFTVTVGTRNFDLTTIINVERGNVSGDLKVNTDIISP